MLEGHYRFLLFSSIFHLTKNIFLAPRQGLETKDGYCVVPEVTPKDHTERYVSEAFD